MSVDAWRAWLISDGKAANTVAAYVRDVSAYLAHSQQDITRGDIVRWLDGSLQSGRAPSSTNRALASLKSYCGWCVSTGLMAVNPAEYVREVTLPLAPPKALSDKDVHRLLSAVRKRGRTRDCAAFGLLFDAGLRRSELASLRVGDVGRDSVTVRTGKNHSHGVLPLSPTTAKYLRELVRGRSADEPLFIGQRGPLTVAGVYELVQSYGLLCGVAVSPHALRHTHANRLIASGADLTVVRERLRHKDISTTQRYTRPTAEQVRQYADKAAVW